MSCFRNNRFCSTICPFGKIVLPEADAMDDGTMRPFACVLAVRDLDAAAQARDALGFTLAWAEITGWRLLTRGDVRLMMGDCPDAPPAAETGDHSRFGYPAVDDIDAVHAGFSARAPSSRTRRATARIGCGRGWWPSPKGTG